MTTAAAMLLADLPAPGPAGLPLWATGVVAGVLVAAVIWFVRARRRRARGPEDRP